MPRATHVDVSVFVISVLLILWAFAKCSEEKVPNGSPLPNRKAKSRASTQKAFRSRRNRPIAPSCHLISVDWMMQWANGEPSTQDEVWILRNTQSLTSGTSNSNREFEYKPKRVYQACAVSINPRPFIKSSSSNQACAPLSSHIDHQPKHMSIKPRQACPCRSSLSSQDRFHQAKDP